MKIAIRAFVLALAITGAAAASHTAAVAQTTTASVSAPLTKSSAFPIPVCPPDDPGACGNPLR